MPVTVQLPEDIVLEIDRHVSAGKFGSRDEAVAYYLRRGLERGPAGLPPGTPPPPGEPPTDDRPIAPKPWDVNWAGRSARDE